VETKLDFYRIYFILQTPLQYMTQCLNHLPRGDVHNSQSWKRKNYFLQNNYEACTCQYIKKCVKIKGGVTLGKKCCQIDITVYLIEQQNILLPTWPL